MDMFDILSQSVNTQNTTALTKAIEKVNAEMEKEKDNSYVQVIGEYLLHQVNIKPELAVKILDGNKTILKSLDVMRKAAEKKIVREKGSKSACVVFTPQEGFNIIIKYFSDELDSTKNKPIKEDNKTFEQGNASEAELDIEAD